MKHVMCRCGGGALGAHQLQRRSTRCDYNTVRRHRALARRTPQQVTRPDEAAPRPATRPVSREPHRMELRRVRWLTAGLAAPTPTMTRRSAPAARSCEKCSRRGGQGLHPKLGVSSEVGPRPTEQGGPGSRRWRGRVAARTWPRERWLRGPRGSAGRLPSGGQPRAACIRLMTAGARSSGHAGARDWRP